MLRDSQGVSVERGWSMHSKSEKWRGSGWSIWRWEERRAQFTTLNNSACSSCAFHLLVLTVQGAISWGESSAPGPDNVLKRLSDFGPYKSSPCPPVQQAQNPLRLASTPTFSVFSGWMCTYWVSSRKRNSGANTAWNLNNLHTELPNVSVGTWTISVVFIVYLVFTT